MIQGKLDGIETALKSRTLQVLFLKNFKSIFVLKKES